LVETLAAWSVASMDNLTEVKMAEKKVEQMAVGTVGPLVDK
jgi:hypothetical protein